MPAVAGLAIAVPFLALLFHPERAQAQAAPSPNVVVMMTDDQDVRSTAVMPKLERHLVRRGTTFRNFFATLPLCCPSRATFLTGQYAHNHGVTQNSPGYHAFDDARTLPVSLRRAGYRTGYVGKYLNHYGGYGKRHPDDIPPGWTDWRVAIEAGHMFDYTLNENGRLRHYGDRARDYQTDVLARKATRFIGASSEGRKPFFLTMSTLAPHAEPQSRRAANPRPAPRHRGAFSGVRLPRPPSFNERDVSDKPAAIRSLPRVDREARRKLEAAHRSRLESLLAVDDAVGSIVEELRRRNELRNTLLVFTSDHGYLLGEHRLTAKSQLYEEAVQAPLIMRGPGIPAGKRRAQLAGNVDLAPTIIDVAGATPERVMDGRSLLPLARRRSAGAGRDLLLEMPRDDKRAVRSPRYMYTEHPDGERELYDMRVDPFQLESLHVGGPHETSRSAALERRLATRLRELEGCAGGACR